MIRLDAATVLLQWATGGMLFCWFTTRRHIISVGYGWLLRTVYLCFALGALAVGLAFDSNPIREVSSALVAAACLFALVVSIVRKDAGVSGHDAEFDRRSDRVAEMTGIERSADKAATRTGTEYNPVLDLVPAIIGFLGLLAASIDAAADSSTWTVIVALLRTLIGAAFIGAISDGMLLGHWYLTQPGLPRKLLNEMVTALAWIWPLEVGALLLPTGMISVWLGTVDDGWGGLLGWMWGMCAITTIVLIFVTRAALKERYYSAVMAATGLLYLAILTGFGTDIVARAVLDQTG